MTFNVSMNWIYRSRTGTRDGFTANAVTKLRVAQYVGEFIDYLRNSQLLQKESARWKHGVKEYVFLSSLGRASS